MAEWYTVENSVIQPCEPPEWSAVLVAECDWFDWMHQQGWKRTDIKVSSEDYLMIDVYIRVDAEKMPTPGTKYLVEVNESTTLACFQAVSFLDLALVLKFIRESFG